MGCYCERSEAIHKSSTTKAGERRRLRLLAMTTLQSGRPLNACLADANLARGIHYRRPGVVRQGYAVPGAIGPCHPFGIAGNEHLLATGDRLGSADAISVAGDIAIKEIRRIDLLGTDVERQHAIGETPVRRVRAGSGQGAAKQLADEGQAGALVLAEGADRTSALGVITRTVGFIWAIQHRGILAA